MHIDLQPAASLAGPFVKSNNVIAVEIDKNVKKSTICMQFMNLLLLINMLAKFFSQI